MSESLVPELRWLVLGSSLGRSAHVPRQRRRAPSLKAQIAAQEQELLRRQHTATSLASQVHALRAELDAASADRARLERELARVATLRLREVERAASLAEAVLDQQAVVRELERALATVLDGHR